MRLFAASVWISLRHSSQRLLCLFCLLAVGAGLVFAVAQSRPEKETPVAVIAVVDLDGDPMAASALRMLAGSRELSGLFRLEFVAEEQAARGGYSAVLTIPEGFTRSVLTGENLSPTVTLDTGSPLEAMWARQMAKAGASYLTSAQLGIYGVLEQAAANEGRVPNEGSLHNAADLSEQEYTELVMKVNLAFAHTFLDRLSLLETETLSAYGSLSLPQYYVCAVGAALLLCYSFLYTPAVLSARQFRRLRGGKGGFALWASSFAHIVLLELATVFALVGAAMAILGRELPHNAVGALAMLALLAGSFSMLVSSLSRSEAVCAVAAMLLGLGSALASGGIVPLAMMPPVFERIAPLLPSWQGASLLSALFGAEAALLPPLTMAAVLLACSLLLWRLDGMWERRRGR